MSVERSIGTRGGAAVASRPAAMSAPRSFGGGEKAMTGFAKYMGNTDRAVRPSDARSFLSAPKISPMPVQADRAVRSFSFAESKVLTPNATANSKTALSVRHEQGVQLARTPRITMIRPVQAERRMTEQPTRKINFPEAKPRQSLLDNKTVTFSDLTYAKTFPMGNKDMFFTTKTYAKEQAVFQKTVSPSKTETIVNQPIIKMTKPLAEKTVSMPYRITAPTLQLKENNKPSLTNVKLEKPNTTPLIPSVRLETIESNKATVPPIKIVEENRKQLITNLNLVKPEVTPVIPTLKEPIQKEIATVDTLPVSAAIQMQVEKQVDQMLLNQVKEQLASIITISQTVKEPEPTGTLAVQAQPEKANKKALLLLATVGETEEKQKKNPLSKENRAAFRKFIVKLFQQVDEEKQVKAKQKEKKAQMRPAKPEKSYFIQDKNAMQNREKTLSMAIKKFVLRNKIRGDAIINGSEIASELPQKPPMKLISKIRFQLLAAVLPGLFGDGSWDAILYRLNQLKDSADKLLHVIHLYPAVEVSQRPTAPVVSREAVQRVLQTSNLPVAA